MTSIELLAAGGFLFSLVNKIGLWHKRTWAWPAGVMSSCCWLTWGLLVAFVQPGSGGWIVLGNNMTFLIMGLIGWWIWAKDDQGTRGTQT